MSPQNSKIKSTNNDDFSLKPFRPTLLQEYKQKIFLTKRTGFLPALTLKLLQSHRGARNFGYIQFHDTEDIALDKLK